MVYAENDTKEGTEFIGKENEINEKGLRKGKWVCTWSKFIVCMYEIVEEQILNYLSIQLVREGAIFDSLI